MSVVAEGMENERKLVERQGVKSNLVAPLIDRGNLIGVLGFDSIRSEREWDETENKARALLTAIGRIRRTPDGAPREPDNAREAARGAASRVSTSV